MRTNARKGHLEGVGKGRMAKWRLKRLNMMLIVTAHLMENGHYEVARKRLNRIYKKVDGENRPRDIVKRGEAQEALALKIKQLIEQLDFESEDS